jgi:hypothetical protein
MEMEEWQREIDEALLKDSIVFTAKVQLMAS